MPRPPRIVLPGVPLHVTQRGVDRAPTFLAPEDYAYYRWMLRDSAAHAGCLVHAYVLMENHIHLLVTPADVGAPSRMMQSLGRRYVRYINDRYRRTGTLWEGRFRSAIVDSTAYLFACSRYIELNPVRAGMVTDPGQYVWSSFRHNALGRPDPLVTSRAEYEALGSDVDRRCLAYHALFRRQLAPTELARIRAEVRGRPKLYASPYRQIVVASALGRAL
jgi:putative transposase